MSALDLFYYDLPKEEREMCVRLREIIFSTIPDFNEQFSYGVPYFFRHNRVCCIWPASAKGGPRKGVFLGFCRGNLLSNEQGIVEMGNRKRFGLIRYFAVKDISEQPIHEILQEAVIIDEEVWQRKKRKK